MPLHCPRFFNISRHIRHEQENSSEIDDIQKKHTLNPMCHINKTTKRSDYNMKIIIFATKYPYVNIRLD